MNFPLTSIAWGMIQVALLCGVVLVLAWVARGRHPQVISAILVGCCFACLALGASIWLPHSQWSVVPKTALILRPDRVATASPLATSESSSSRIWDMTDKSPQSNEINEATSSTSVSGSRLKAWILAHVQGFDRSLRSVEDAERLQPSGVSTNAWALCTVGLILMVALWLYSWLYMRRILRKSLMLESQIVSEQVAAYSAKLKLCREPQIRVSDQVPIGAMVGCFRHVLILHSSWARWTESELQAVLLHELAHAARRDFLWVVISSWVRNLFFFHPLVQLVVKRLRLEQELAADQLAAGFMESANAYGRALASLALRSQNSVRAPSPMLTAEQICIVRRITMLKHGSLMPRQTLLRWASCLTLVTLLLSLPLSGLRGTPLDENGTATDQKAKAASASDADEATARKEKQEAETKLAEEVEEKYPRLRFTGPMIWNPGRFQSPDISAGVQWAHYVYTVMALGGFPQEGEVYGRSELQVTWSDLAREHGQFMASASVEQADQIMPNILSRLFDSPEFGPHTLSKNKKVIEGRVASEVVIQGKKASSNSQVEHSIDSWVIDDEQGFVHGTEQEVAQIVRGEANPFADVPEVFLADYKTAAFATVFDCKEWSKKVLDFYVGSPEQIQWAMVAPILKDLKQLGVFVQGREEGDCRLRAVYVDDQAATKAKEVVDGLLYIAHAFVGPPNAPSSVEDNDATIILTDLLKSIRFEQQGAELKLTLRSPKLSLFTEQYDSVVGWLPWIDKKAEQMTVESKTVRLEGQPFGSFGGFLAQTIDAKSYRGKRVRLVAELGTHPDASNRAGVFLWTSGQQDRTLSFNSRSIDGKSDMPNQLTVVNRQEYLHDTEVKWITTSVEVDVPADSQVLSFGAYTKNADLRVRNVQFEVIADKVGTVFIEKPWLPYNLFVIPGNEIQSAPRNLDFSEPLKTISTEAEQVADKETDAVRR